VNGVNAESEEGGGDDGEVGASMGTAPTAPSPPPRQNDPFEAIDELPSVHSASDKQPPMDVSEVRLVPQTMTPPLTPVLSRDQPQDVDGGTKYLTILGGYGWRG
jgi:hypothetical protein